MSRVDFKKCQCRMSVHIVCPCRVYKDSCRSYIKFNFIRNVCVALSLTPHVARVIHLGYPFSDMSPVSCLLSPLSLSFPWLYPCAASISFVLQLFYIVCSFLLNSEVYSNNIARYSSKVCAVPTVITIHVL